MNRARRSDAGLTLVELLVSVVILAMITGALTSVFITAFNGSRPTNERVRESNDAQLIAAYLVRDAQSAGGTNPSVGVTKRSISSMELRASSSYAARAAVAAPTSASVIARHRSTFGRMFSP